MQRTDYRFTLTRDTDTFEVTPLNFYAGSFKYTQNEGQLFFRKEYSGELIFKGTDYAYFKTRYDLASYCDIFELLIEKNVNGIYIVDWTGYFSMTDGKFDFERCEYKVEPTLEDNYSCLLRNKDIEYNILNVAHTDITGYIKSVLEFEIQYSGSTTPPSTTNPGMVYMTFRLRMSSPLTYCHIFARESVLLQKGITPSGSGWVQVVSNSESNVIEQLEFNDEFDKWGRSWITAGVSAPGVDDLLLTYDVVNSDCSITETTPASLGYTGNYLKFMTGRYRCPGSITSVSKHSLWINKTIYSGALYTQSTMYRARNLIYCLQYILNQACSDSLTIVSSFLQNATNPITILASKTNHLYFIQKSDAKRPNSSNPATIGNISFETFMNLLYNIFQLNWYIEGTNFNIIHQSEISNTTGLDITIQPYLLTSGHKKLIEFNKELLYRFEQWQFMESEGEDFIGMPIEYDELCSMKEVESKTKTYSISNITTDLGYVQTKINKISDEGFVLISTDGSDIFLEDGLLSYSSQLNGHLSLTNLHYNYWRHNRILSTGLMNGTLTNFLSTQKIRKLQEQSIILCEDFDPLKQVTTELGTANINEAEFFPNDNKLVLNMSI